MKKIIPLILLLCFITITFCGCSGASDHNNADAKTTETVFEDKPADNNIFSKTVTINDELISYLGISVSQAIDKFGDIETAEWWDGPIFKHKNSELWFAYSNVDYQTLTADESAIVTAILCSVSDLLYADKISEEIFTDNVIKSTSDTGSTCFSFQYKNAHIFIDCNPDGSIDKTSSVTITSRE